MNLIDSSNKDEKYFATISKLIELSRAKDVDLPETVIADVEFFTTVNKPEAAQNRIVEYTKTHPNFGFEMFYYLSYAFYRRGDFASAARYGGQIPDNKAFSPKVFHLKGEVFLALGSQREALGEFEKAVKMSPAHVRSRLAIARILSKEGRLRDASAHLDFILEKPALSSPLPLAEAFYLRGLLNELHQKNAEAMADMEKAVKLNPENHDYLLELYTLRAKAGETDPRYREKARMYYFLGEGERKLKAGNHEQALVDFLQARDADLEAPLPLEKIGDMFLQLNNMIDALMNYRKAAEKAPEDIRVWSKYIQTLIQSYELKEANEAMKRFKSVPGARSSIDKLFGDLYAKQAMHPEAQIHYRKAMARDSIDPSVYVAYATSLRESGACQDAPFYYALGLRLDPLNMDAIVGTAKCIAQTDSIQRAITMLQDELQKLGGARAELVAAVAELRMQAGDWDLAEDSVSAAMAMNPKYAFPWLLQATIYRNKEGLDKEAIPKALIAYKSYIERNPSDPKGYLERYKLFMKLGQFDKASDELAEIFKYYPKYPGIHFFKGNLYSLMGNTQAALQEFEQELSSHPESVEALIALGKEKLKAEGDKDAANAALELFTKAMQINPISPEAKQQAGWASYYLKNYTGAIALLQAAAAGDAGNPVIYKRMGIVYRAMGDGASAGEAFRKYVQLAPDAPDRAEFERFAE
ncbi:MAG: tetratricopeptide repeat protein [Bdellovibrionales bacterium]|nr:tetratricopeptide repeat protein [Bdellovibrionales bacterium]